MKKSVERRREEIINYLLTYERVTVAEVAEKFQTTPETARKDLQYLEDRRFIFRTHGGAILRNSNVDIPLDVRAKERMDIKKSICQEVIKYIPNDATIFVDPSSTALALGRLIRLKKNIVLVTNCFDLVNVAADSLCEILFLGGNYTRSGGRTQGQFGIDMVNRLSFDVAVFGTDGTDGLDGPGCMSEDATFLNQAIIHRSRLNILVTESVKFGLNARYQYADYRDFDILVTDTQLDPAIRAAIPVKNIITVS